MRKIIIFLFLVNLFGLGYLFVSNIPAYMEIVLGYYLPMIAACILSLLVLALKVTNKVVLMFVLLICLISPTLFFIESKPSVMRSVDGTEMQIPEGYR